MYSSAMHAAVGVSHSSDLTRAIEEASAIARAGLAGEAELALTFVSTAHGRIDAGVGRIAPQQLGADRSATAHVEGLLCPEGEHTGTPVVAVIGLAGTEFELYSFDHARGREGELGEELAATFEPLGGDDLVLVVADAQELDARPLAAGLAACAPAAVLGVGVEGGTGCGARGHGIYPLPALVVANHKPAAAAGAAAGLYR